MELAELDKRLKYGETWGFRKLTGSEDYLGWVLVERRHIAPVTPFDPYEEPELYAQWLKRTEEVKKHPYMILTLELKRSVHENKNLYPENTDYRDKRVDYCATLEEVEEILRQRGYDLRDIRNGREIDAP